MLALAHVVDGDDVRVPEMRDELRVFDEVRGERGILAQVRGRQLERHVAVEAADAGRPCQVHGRHPTLRDR